MDQLSPQRSRATYIYLTPHSLYLAIGRSDEERRDAYRDLFRSQLDGKAIDDI